MSFSSLVRKAGKVPDDHASALHSLALRRRPRFSIPLHNAAANIAFRKKQLRENSDDEHGKKHPGKSDGGIEPRVLHGGPGHFSNALLQPGVRLGGPEAPGLLPGQGGEYGNEPRSSGGSRVT